MYALYSVVKVYIDHFDNIFEDNQRIVSILYNKETLTRFQSLFNFLKLKK